MGLRCGHGSLYPLVHLSGAFWGVANRILAFLCFFDRPFAWQMVSESLSALPVLHWAPELWPGTTQPEGVVSLWGSLSKCGSQAINTQIMKTQAM